MDTINDISLRVKAISDRLTEREANDLFVKLAFIRWNDRLRLASKGRPETDDAPFYLKIAEADIIRSLAGVKVKR